MTKKKSMTCSICLETIKRPAYLNLSCDCRYNVHYKCYMRWWRENKTCIICHEICEKPISWIEHRRKKKRKRQTPPWKNIIIRETIQPRHLVIDPRTSIEPYINYINNLPFDNENEIKTITIGFILATISCYIYYTLLHVE